MESQIQAFEMWCFRRSNEFNGGQKKSNENVLRQIGHNKIVEIDQNEANENPWRIW